MCLILDDGVLLCKAQPDTARHSAAQRIFFPFSVSVPACDNTTDASWGEEIRAFGEDVEELLDGIGDG
jgi:hypothetical protein